MTIRITIPGRPITKKNHGQVVIRGGRRYHVPSKAYGAYENFCLGWLLQWRQFHFPGPVIVQAHYFMPNRRSWPDLVGLQQATGDILEKSKIIANDRNIVSWENSKIIGIDEENPRVEITIRNAGYE